MIIGNTFLSGGSQKTAPRIADNINAVAIITSVFCYVCILMKLQK